MINPNTNALPAAITGSTTNNVPAHLEEVKDAINGGSLLRRLSQAQIDALSGATRPTGLVVVNLTRGCPQMWTGSAWVDVAVGAGVWQAFTPTLIAEATNPTGWTVTGRFARIGTTIHAKIRAVAGAGFTVGAGRYIFTLPTNTAWSDAEILGLVRVDQQGSGSFWAGQARLWDTWGAFIPYNATDSFGSYMPWTEATWSVGARIDLALTYEAA